MAAFSLSVIILLCQAVVISCDPLRNQGTAACCTDIEWKCQNKKCIPATDKCDGKDDCGDNSDEKEGCFDLSNSCGRGRMMCRSILKCVGNHAKCNGVDDCGDNSDEDNCPLQYGQCPRGKPLVDEHGMAYSCGNGPRSQTCPDNSACHINPLDCVAVCCPV